MTYHLLNVDKNAKTVKGQKEGYLTGILYLAPYDVSGYQVCPSSTKGCRESCLYSAGRGAFSSVQNARIRKTRLLFEDSEEFLDTLAKDINKLEREAKRKGLKPCVRLNGTSDINWLEQGYVNIISCFPGVQFYDYTKSEKYFAYVVPPQRKAPSNYYLTFSYSEINIASCLMVLDNKWGNVAVVFKDSIPKIYMGYPVLDGDKNDLRFTDKKGYVVGLKAKGKAKKDTTGFVI